MRCKIQKCDFWWGYDHVTHGRWDVRSEMWYLVGSWPCDSGHLFSSKLLVGILWYDNSKTERPHMRDFDGNSECGCASHGNLVVSCTIKKVNNLLHLLLVQILWFGCLEKKKGRKNTLWFGSPGIQSLHSHLLFSVSIYNTYLTGKYQILIIGLIYI